MNGSRDDRARRSAELLAKIQGWFYLAAGAWPLVSGMSFQQVTGFKVDFWLAQTVGVLLVVSGLVMILAGRAKRVTREIGLLAALQAAGLLIVDVYCVTQPNTTRAYLLDALAEAALVILWIRVWRTHRAK